MSKVDGKTSMGQREATDAEHGKHVEAGYYVARLKGGSLLHLRKPFEDAVCGARPAHKGGFLMRDRSGWETYTRVSAKRASCMKCLNGFRLPAPPPPPWPFPTLATKETP